MPRSPATCHPDRPLMGHGLCKTCYFREYRRRWREANPEQNQALQRDHKRASYHRDPEKHRRRAQAARYGLTPAEVDAMRQAQGGRCAACGEPGPLQVDHDHQTGAVRGLLCGPCNSALGYARDDIGRLMGLASYLIRATDVLGEPVEEKSYGSE